MDIYAIWAVVCLYDTEGFGKEHHVILHRDSAIRNILSASGSSFPSQFIREAITKYLT
jgi:hypothetical protein